MVKRGTAARPCRPPHMPQSTYANPFASAVPARELVRGNRGTCGQHRRHADGRHHREHRPEGRQPQRRTGNERRDNDKAEQARRPLGRQPYGDGSRVRFPQQYKRSSLRQSPSRLIHMLFEVRGPRRIGDDPGRHRIAERRQERREQMTGDVESGQKHQSNHACGVTARPPGAHYLAFPAVDPTTTRQPGLTPPHEMSRAPPALCEACPLPSLA